MTGKSTIRQLFLSPVFWAFALFVPLAVLLFLPVSLPVGPMYWDTYLYLDAAQRIWMNQIPSVDFSTPVGAMPYYLFAAGLALFDNAQPLLLAQWCIIPVAVALLSMVLAKVSEQHRGLAFALLIPFIVFATFPANVASYHPLPSIDGFGVYNRHAVLFLYVLTSGLVFLKDGPKMAVFIAGTMLALFLTKITGFLVGGLFCLMALLAGRIAIRNCVLSVVLFAIPLAAIELLTGMVSGYLRDIAILTSMNTGILLPRFLTVVSLRLDVLLPAGLLALVLAWIDWTHRSDGTRLLDRSFIWFPVIVAGGIIFETQNTGSQEFIFIWPVILMIYLRLKPFDSRIKLIALALSAFCVIPTFTNVAHKTLRALAVATSYTRLDLPEVRNMSQLSARDGILERATYLEPHYEAYADAYADLSAHGQLPSWQYYSELDFQLYWIMSANTLVKSFKAFEAERGVHLDSLLTLDFTNPFPWLLNRDATRHVQIGADPYRTVPPMTPETTKAVQETAAVLRPKCPLTTGRRVLYAHYEAALAGRTVVSIHPCWDLLVRPDILAAKN